MMQFKKGLGWKASIGPPTDMVIDENYAELGTWTNIQTSGNVMSEELTDAGGWTFAVYSHYNRGHFYNDRPKVYVTYKGGNNHNLSFFLKYCKLRHKDTNNKEKMTTFSL